MLIVQKFCGRFETKPKWQHSPVIVEINGRRLVEPEDGDWAVNVSALYLLRTLERPLILGEDEQMFPCCGHVPALDQDGRFFNIGCPNGVHLEIERSGDNVRVTSDAGVSGSVPFPEWRNAVIRFADRVEAFYANATKEISDADDQKAMSEFWREWRELRKRA